VRIDAAGLTDRGCTRENNEDAFLADAQAGVFLVADGMGGLEAGEVVSRMAVETVAERLFPAMVRTGWGLAGELERFLVLAFEEANARILSFTGKGPGPAKAGTTLVGLARCEASFVLANVGDSRAYLIRGQGIRQLSEDHSLVMARVRQGLITPEEAAKSQGKNVIYRALGLESRLEVDSWIIPAAPGDAFLLCSDGLSGVLADQDILHCVRQGAGDATGSVCERLISLALERKARDNVTVVLARCLP